MPNGFDWTSVYASFSVILSVIALVLSAISLWKGYLSPFRLEIAQSELTFCIYKITPGQSGDKSRKVWWVPSFSIGFSFHNKGQKVGKVLDVRIIGDAVLEGRKLNIGFHPSWIVKPDSFWRDHHDRFKWLSTSVDRVWYPVILPAKGTVHLHLVLESDRWEQKREGRLDCRLEVLSSEDELWRECGKYRVAIVDRMYEYPETWTADPIKQP
jgi:hypothetical protein